MKSFAAWVLGASLVGAAGCGGASAGDATDGSTLFSTTKGDAQCGHAPGVDDGGAGACVVGRAALVCDFPNGGGCVCVTDDATCGGCGAPCTNRCAANEYALYCGGPPHVDSSFQYADPPAGCRSVVVTPAGSQFYCCPCQ